MRCSDGRVPRGADLLGSALAAALVAATVSGDLVAQPAVPESAIVFDIGTGDPSIRRRAELAARESVAAYSEWLGPRQNLTITLTGIPWRSAPATMDVESLVAYETARLWWRDRFGETPLVNGVAWYLQSRVVERLYDLTFERPGHSSDSVAFFGGVVPWSFPGLRMSRWSAGLARAEWQRTAARWPFTGRRLPASLDAQAIRLAMDLASFEHAAGWPTLQAALLASVNSSSRGRDLSDVLNDAAGLSMVGPPAASGFGDLAITSVSQQPCPDRPCRLTRIGVSRDDGVPGQTAALRVDFADGQHLIARIGAGEQAREFEFESAADYAVIRLDPARTVLGDVNLLNNTRYAAPASNVPLAKWLARWVLWLEDAMLSYSALL